MIGDSGFPHPLVIQFDDNLYQEYIRTKLSYRFLVVDAYSKAKEIEDELKSGKYDPPGKPFLNPM